MLTSTAFNWLHRLVTLLLLAIVTGFIWLNSIPDYRSDDVLQDSHQITDRLWLYTTRNESGGATVPIIYRYFLSNQLKGNSKAQAEQLKQQMPFLQGYGSISAITQEEGDKIHIIYSGNVLSLDRTATYRDGGRPVTLNLSYQIN